MLDDAITYADRDLARQIAREGLRQAQCKELLGEIMYFKAQAEIIDENYKEAVSYLDRAIQYNPCDGAAYNDRALCIIDLNRIEGQLPGSCSGRALADFDKGIEVEPDYAGVYHNKGWYLNQLGCHREAIPYFEKALVLEPGRAVTYENLADAYLNLGEKTEAIHALYQALQYLKSPCIEIQEQLETKIKTLIIGDTSQ